MAYNELIIIYLTYVSTLPISALKKKRLLTAFNKYINELQNIESDLLIHSMPLSKMI